MKYSLMTPVLMTISLASYGSAYQEAISTLEQAPQNIKEVMSNAPKTYNFASQFDASASSVAYTGQTFRQVLINDLYVVMNGATRAGYNGPTKDATDWLSSYYDYSEDSSRSADNTIDGSSFFAISAVDIDGQSMEIDEGFFYSDIQSPGKNLLGKMAGVDNPLRRGQLYGATGFATPDALVQSWFNEFAANVTSGQTFTVPNGLLPAQTISKAKTTVDGRDLAQLTQKFLHGAISYSQSARDYFSTDLGPTKGLNADNTVPAKQGVKYTAMEHHFDEGFGYFGGARDFLSYSDLESRTKKSIDTDGNGFIALKSEKNMGISTNVSRFDLTAADGKPNRSQEIMEALLKGRHLIAQKPEGYKKYAVAQARVALGVWEETLAAVTIHYINRTIKMTEAYGSKSYLFDNYAKFWSEMKGFGLAFQFNPKGIMTDEDFDQMHALMKDAPVVPHAEPSLVKGYINDLLLARAILERTYGFSATNVQNW